MAEEVVQPVDPIDIQRQRIKIKAAARRRREAEAGGGWSVGMQAGQWQDPATSLSGSSVVPGKPAPDEDWSTEHPDVGLEDRTWLQNLSGKTGEISKWYKERGYDTREAGGTVLLRNKLKGEKVFRPFDKPSLTPRDLLDLPGDVAEAGAAALGGIGTAAATGGNPLAAIGGATAGAGVVSAGREGLARIAGIAGSPDDQVKNVANSMAFGMAGEGLGQLGGKVVRSAVEGLAKGAEREAAEKALERAILDEGARARGAASALERKSLQVPDAYATVPLRQEGEALSSQAKGLGENLRSVQSKAVKREFDDAYANLQTELNKERARRGASAKPASQQAAEGAVRKESVDAAAVRGVAGKELTEDMVDDAITSPYKSTIRRVSFADAVDGIKAEYLAKAPSLRHALNEAVPGFAPDVGSLSMRARGVRTRLKEMEIPQGEADEASKKLAMAVVNWAKSQEGKDISLAASKALDHISKGSPSSADLSVLQDIISRASQKPQSLQDAWTRVYQAREAMAYERLGRSKMAEAQEGTRTSLAKKIEKNRQSKASLRDEIELKIADINRSRRAEKLLSNAAKDNLQALKEQIIALGGRVDPTPMGAFLPGYRERMILQALGKPARWGASKVNPWLQRGGGSYSGRFAAQAAAQGAQEATAGGGNREFSKKVGVAPFRPAKP